MCVDVRPPPEEWAHGLHGMLYAHMEVVYAMGVVGWGRSERLEESCRAGCERARDAKFRTKGRGGRGRHDVGRVARTAMCAPWHV